MRFHLNQSQQVEFLMGIFPFHDAMKQPQTTKNCTQISLLSKTKIRWLHRLYQISGSKILPFLFSSFPFLFLSCCPFSALQTSRRVGGCQDAGSPRRVLRSLPGFRLGCRMSTSRSLSTQPCVPTVWAGFVLGFSFFLASGDIWVNSSVFGYVWQRFLLCWYGREQFQLS